MWVFVYVCVAIRGCLGKRGSLCIVNGSRMKNLLCWLFYYLHKYLFFF